MSLWVCEFVGYALWVMDYGLVVCGFMGYGLWVRGLWVCGFVDLWVCGFVGLWIMGYGLCVMD